MGLALKTPALNYNYPGKQLSSPGGQSAVVSVPDEKFESCKSSKGLHDGVFVAD